MIKLPLYSFIILIFLGTLIYGEPHPMVGQKAPEIHVDHWFNLEGQSHPKQEDYRGKVLYIYCFQSWCPGCHQYGFPALKQISDALKDSDAIAFLAIQTVFEGFGSNTVAKVEETRKKYDLDFPFGHDDGGGKGSSFMRDYRTGGTPWHIIIDQKGDIVFSGFHVHPRKTIDMLRQLIQK